MGGTRGVRIGFEPAQRRLYVRLPADRDLKMPSEAYSELSLELYHEGDGYVLEVSTMAARYYREFHRFASLLAEEYERGEQTASAAFRTAIQGWQDFAARRAVLTDEQQLGLFGELLVLEGMMADRGVSAVDAWIGRGQSGPARHDFRLGRTDLEIKTTRSATRRHVIHGAEQLVPAAGHQLYLLSLRLEASGAVGGRSLPAQVSRLRNRLSDNEKSRDLFEQKLWSAQYRDEDAFLFNEHFIFSDRPRLIPVDEQCPRITTSLLNAGMRADLASRIDQISYYVNLEGLGVSEGSAEYTEILGRIRLIVE
jgi:hypothetical protein